MNELERRGEAVLHTGDLKIADEQHTSKFKDKKGQRCTALSHLVGA